MTKKCKKMLAFLVCSGMIGSLFPFSSLGSIHAETAVGNDSYFYDQLKSESAEETNAYQNFYKAMEQMLSSGKFANGEDLDLVNAGYFTSEQVANYAGGKGNVLNIYGAARDAFTGDHPEVFYVDFSALSIRIATISGEYHMYLGSGRRDTYWTESFTSADEVQIAIRAYNSAFESAYSTLSGETDADFIEAAHDYITANTSYRLENKFAPEDTDQYLIRTSYGSLVNHKAVCEGYARLFKAFMDKRGIPCVLVQGAYRPDAESYELHMWTYVELDGAWYAVDPTIDDPTNNKKGADAVGVDGYENHEYLLKGENKMAVKYAPSGIRSESNYEFSYPPLNYDNYGSEVVYNSNGLMVSYEETLQSDGEKAGQYTVSYKGMGLRKAREAGYYMLFDSVVEKRANVSSSSTSSSVKPGEAGYDEQVAKAPLGDYGWTGMCYLAANAEVMMGSGALDNPENDMYDTDTAFVFKLPQCPYVRFAVTTEAPEPFSFGDMVIDDPYFQGDNMSLLATTDMIYNPNGLYKAPPYPKEVSPGLTSALLIDEGEQELRSTYDQDLFFDEAAGKVTLRMSIKDQYNIQNTSAFGHSKVRDFRVLYREGDDIVESDTINITLQSLQKKDYKDENGFDKYDEIPGEEVEIFGNQSAEYLKGKTIVGFVFKFTPSTMYADDNIFYEFDVKGLKAGTLHVPYQVMNGDGSMQEETKYAEVEGKEPIAISYLAAHRCAAYAFQSQGYDWNVFGKPTLMDDLSGFDLSSATFKNDKSDMADGFANLNEALQGLTHRMVLVATDANDEQVSEMDQLLEVDAAGLGDIRSAAELENAEYYNINLTLCKSQIVSTGQAVRVTLGFPAGYGPEDKGKTFKVYHFSKNDNGNITGVNEIPCEITEYGLVVWCDAFSPFAIVPVDIQEAESALAGNPEKLKEFQETVESKSVIYTNNSDGGTLTSSGASDHEGSIKVSDGETAQIQVTAKEGYDIESITVGNISREVADKDNTIIELPYADLAEGATVVDVQFVSEKVVEKEQEKGADAVKPSTTASKYKDGFSAVTGHSITLDGTIGLNFFVDIKQGVDITGAKAIVKVPDGTISEWTDFQKDSATGYYKFCCQVPAKDISGNVTFQIVLKDGRSGTEYTYSVDNYLKAMANEPEKYEKEQKVVAALSSYGSSAQQFFAGQNVAETEEMQAITATTLEESKATIANTPPEGITYNGTSLILESNTTIRHYFEVTSEELAQTYQMMPASNGLYYLEQNNINAQELNTPVSVSIGDFTIAASPLSYAYAVLNSDATDANLKNLVKSLYLYYQAANKYQKS